MRNNRKFNARLKRYERWHRIVRKLSEFEGLINEYTACTPEEITALKDIHRKLYECYGSAKAIEEELRPYDLLGSR